MKSIQFKIISFAVIFTSILFFSGCNSINGNNETNSQQNVEVSKTNSNCSRPDGVTMPWDEAGSKQPKDYTWKEFEALSMEQADAFISSFKSEEEFNEWAESAMKTKEKK